MASIRATRSTLRLAIPRQPVAVVRARFGPWPPPVVGVVHVELGHRRERLGLVGDGRVDDLEHEHALAGVGGHADPAVADPELGVGERHQRAAAGVAEQHDGLRAPAHHLVVRGVDVDDALLVQAIGVVVHVSGGEPQDGVPGGRQQRARVVDAEVAARMAEDHRRLPRSCRRAGSTAGPGRARRRGRRAGSTPARRRHRGRRRGAASIRGRTDGSRQGGRRAPASRRS